MTMREQYLYEQEGGSGLWWGGYGVTVPMEGPLLPGDTRPDVFVPAGDPDAGWMPAVGVPELLGWTQQISGPVDPLGGRSYGDAAYEDYGEEHLPYGVTLGEEFGYQGSGSGGTVAATPEGALGAAGGDATNSGSTSSGLYEGVPGAETVCEYGPFVLLALAYFVTKGRRR